MVNKPLLKALFAWGCIWGVWTPYPLDSHFVKWKNLILSLLPRGSLKSKVGFIIAAATGELERGISPLVIFGGAPWLKLGKI